MNNKNNNYRVMKFLEPVNKNDKYKGYVRLDIRGSRGMIIVSVENLGDSKSTSDVYLYKDKKDKIKIGNINNKKGMIKKNISFENNGFDIKDYNVCGVVKNNKIVLYSNLYNVVTPNDIRKLEETISAENLDEKKDEGLNIKDFDEKVENKNDNENETYIENETAKVDQDVNTNIQEEICKDSENEEDEEVNDALGDVAVEPDAEFGNLDAEVESSSRKTGHKNKFEENLFDILNGYNKLEPLSVCINNLTWWKIPYDDRGVKNGFLPYYNQIISSYYPFPMSNRVTTCNGLIKKYGHYLFGIYKENNNIKRFVYGVPGEFKRDEQPYKGITGFKNWSYKNKDIDGAFGYWIAFVDSNTGEVTEPPQIVLGK